MRGVRVLPMVGLFLVLLLGRFPTGRLPQVVKGDDALSVAFGDARAVLAQMMIRKSDSYFHGGVDIDCPHDEDHGTAQSNNDFADPWGWINAHVRVPYVHSHLEGEKAVELLPFYWAAIRADPHHVENWTTAIFIAENELKDRALAERLIAEAKVENPESAEIAFAEGRFLRKNGTGDLKAARAAFERAREFLLKKGDGLLENDQVLMNLIMAFLDEK